MSATILPAAAAERLAACKRYMQVDIDDDDELVFALLRAADSYLEGAGINRAVAPEMYDLIAFDMALRIYDGRETEAAQAATVPLVRCMLNQLKLLSAYGEDGDGESGTDERQG